MVSRFVSEYMFTIKAGAWLQLREFLFLIIFLVYFWYDAFCFVVFRNYSSIKGQEVLPGLLFSVLSIGFCYLCRTVTPHMVCSV